MIKQGSAVMRIVAIAVSIAIVIGFSSVMFQVIARAESVDNVNALDLSAHQLGTLGSYPVIGIPTSGLLADYISTSDDSGSMSMRDYFLPFVVFNGDIYYYNRLVYIGYHKSYFDKFPNCALAFYGQCNFSPIYDSLKSGNTSPSKKFDYRYFSFSESGNTLTVTNSEYPSNTWTVTYEFKSASGVTLSSSNVNRILFARVKTCLSTDDTVDVSDLSPYINSSDTYKDIDTGASPSAEFLSFKGTESSGLYLVDWVQAGQQYPIVDFRIDDKGNYHKYALRISGNSNYAEILKGIWDRQEMKEAASAASNAVGVFLLLKAAASLGTKAVVSIAGAATPIGALFLNVPKKDVTGYVMLAAQNKLVQEYDTLSYDDIRTLTSDNMNFSEGSSTVSKAVSLCLSDYVSVVPNTLYKLEIIDVTDSKLLDVAYFSSQRGYQKSDSGYGTNITDYDNSADLDSDIENNNGYTGGSSSNGGKLDTDNPNDIIDTDYNNSLANINISDIIVSLRTSIASVGVFFQSCWALFPPAIWSIILLGLSLIVVLRLLGR